MTAVAIEQMRAELARLEAPPGELSAGEYSATQQQLVLLSSLLAALNLPAFLAEIDRVETTAPLLNPELYARAADKLERVKALAIAASTVRDEVLRQARLEIEERSRR